ncbi:MAG: 2-oxoacid:acceptor oxidoreductase subunit alpha [Deltaproteobacteria bacterium]|nr:2-oxoacid:acceptor oxidoreductase subunit alpha [Deltaproteobacteria bacterium]
MERAQPKDISILLSGEAGQGLQTLEKLLLNVFKRSGFHVYSYSEFMSRIRGGNNSTEIRISTSPVSSCRKMIDVIVPFTSSALERFVKRITPQTLIFGDRELIPENYYKDGFSIVSIPLTQMARDAGGATVLNMIVLGVLSGFLGVEFPVVETQLVSSLSSNDSARLARNLTAATRGHAAGSLLRNQFPDTLPVIERTNSPANTMLLNGIDAVGMGGLAGGCNFVASYPMSPSTGVLVFFARQAHDFGVVVEQAEDEISAVNMALGAWYAGGRALVTTSGGGFALMVEGLSLAGAVESPLVIHVGQRPGPATGLPTRTEQADLEHALYSGHGEFPRAILAPGTVEEGFSLTRHAFRLADTYQVPVIILTDQNFLESYHLVNILETGNLSIENRIVRTDDDYRRYAVTDDGVSPRGIPGYGEGIVCADSDEHDEGGYITEDMDVRIAMVQKRLKKLPALEAEAIPPTLVGKVPCTYLVVGWGSTFHVVNEALEALGYGDIAFLHFSQVYPLHEGTAGLLSQARKRIIIENNSTGQFCRLIKMHTGIDFDERILKFDGMPFMLEDVVARLESIVKEATDDR